MPFSHDSVSRLAAFPVTGLWMAFITASASKLMGESGFDVARGFKIGGAKALSYTGK